jgi:dGTPase
MAETRTFLFEHVYLGVVARSTRQMVETVISSLLEHYASTVAAKGLTEEAGRTEAVDYVAGMTDRFALRTFETLVGGPPVTTMGAGTGELG